MSLFSIVITEKENLSAAKKQLFKNRQRSLSFIESDSILDDTKSFRDRDKFVAVIVEGYFSSLEYDENYIDRYNGNNRSHLEDTFSTLAKTQLIAFGYYFDDIKRRKGFDNEVSITSFTKIYKENFLYIVKPA